MLMALLALIGLAPAEATHNPCMGPTWALSAQTALACDFQDANAAASILHRDTYRGERTHTSFIVVRLNGSIAKAILVSDKVESEADARKDAALIGANGGWVDQSGVAHGTADSWAINIAQTGFPAKQGALVSLVSSTSN
ncbi:hypothetical protein [Burkholderia multivorans]|uniref:hypothetical protein n=1 Tax=Burkholderia multivorans TaxID=87883 RepID=UPI00158DE664|nr:hypothetical protein [Burkholderia multivorans]MDR8877548.1 hypothetical protein [Burkholderia multivorans]MDR8882493.1 hypothetical protein [Burkholderia multivorans]MDR8889446.1 hypothetical protein [Burkholderia multivorans]MDR8908799.1 hypothetical protein [Burkholderia multivorans]MDR8913908.1 hypothetical protein [Burkholderia multivorans]